MDLNEFYGKLDEKKERIVMQVERLATKICPECAREIKWNALCYFKGGRPFVGILPYSKYTQVIFDRGSELKDPKGLLEGKGKLMKHIKIFDIEDLQNKKVADYIQQSFMLD
jgi:hypothetical protein